MKKKKLVFVLGIRPDIIRAVLILRHLEKTEDIEIIFVWSGQHYSDNLKGIFFREFRIRNADYELNCKGDTDAQIAGELIKKLYPLLEKIKPDAVAFLGDTNTTIASVVPAMLNIPIIHIEGCWHSYDWRMPEEKFRTLTDHLADIIYTYEEEYKERGIAEGLNPKNIVVTRNPIVDILNEFYYKQKKRLDMIGNEKFFKKRVLEKKKYYLLTCHRRENVHIEKSFDSILALISKAKYPVYFPASYRTQKIIKQRRIKTPKNLILVDPVGYEEMLILMTNSKGIFTDSGTVIEEASIFNIPAVQMRKSTERPQVYDVGGTVKFDPDQPEKYTPEIIYKKLEKITGRSWKHTLGDGRASERIAKDIINRLRSGRLRGHLPENSNLPLERSFIEDGIKI